MTTDMSVEDIQKQMSLIRCEMHEDMQTIVDNARILTDWRYYVGKYPWAMLGASLALGYFIVPSKRRFTVSTPSDPAVLAELEKTREALLQVTGKQKDRGIFGSLLKMGTGALMQGALTLLRKQAENYLNARQLQSTPHQPPMRNG